MTEIKVTQHDILNELARRDFKYFVKKTFKGYYFSKFSLHVCEALNQFLKDIEDEKRPILIIQAPPQHGKSELASRRFPAFAFGRNPDFRIAECSYSADLANSMNRDVQRIMLDDDYKSLFSESSLNPERISTLDSQPLRNSERFDIVGHRGYYVSTGVGGPLTGKSVDIGIIDDPIKNMKEARSVTTKEAIVSWYNTVFLSRLSRKSGQLIMMTRWALDDLVGYVLEKNKNNNRVKLLSFPAINENNEALVPELHPLSQLEEFRVGMSSSEWAALYQQSPIIEGGNLIKTEWFQRYGVVPARMESIFIIADTAFSEKKSADNSAFGLFGTAGKDLYMLDGYCKKVIFPDLRRDLKSFYEKARNTYSYIGMPSIYIENKGSGISLIQQLREEGMPIRELQPTVHNKTLKKDQIADKYLRFNEIAADLESGYLHIPESAPWLLEFISECEAFTGGRQDTHDDFVDVLIYALKVRRQATATDWNALCNSLMSR